MHYEKFPDGSVKCIENEIPFELPQGWEWCRLSVYTAIMNGDRGKNYPSKDKLSKDNSGIPFISASDINNGYVVKDNMLYMSNKQYELLSAGKLKLGDIVFCIRGSLGKCGRFMFDNGAIASSLVIVRGFVDEESYLEYLYQYLLSPIIFDEIKKYDNGSAQPNLAAKDFMKFFVPVPPLAEQHRIVSKINELLSFVDIIESDKTDLQTTIQLTKSKILDLAIRGKLVPQNPDDEPASVLLDRIRAEKEELIKQGKIKRDKKESVIFKGDDNSYYEVIASKTTNIDDDLPFELPDGWEWCRLGSIMDICSSKRVLQSEWKKEGVPFYRAREIVKLSETGRVDNDLFISEEHYQNLKKDYGIPKSGDLMVSGVGTIGKVYIVCENDKFYYKDASVLCFQNTYNALYPLYAKLLIDSSFVQKQMSDNSKGTTVDTITISTATTYLCILPPINEQKRIADKVSQLFSLLDSIAENIN